ncbi:MAG: radical SAM protein [bacterium]|nr:radical SAM protein [bacterium]
MKNLSVSDNLHFRQVDAENDISIGWNRFYPSIFMLNRYALDLLDSIKNKQDLGEDDEIKEFVEQLLKYKFVYDSDTDPSQKDFLRMLDDAMAEVRQNGEDFYSSQKNYSSFTIFTDECNLGCAYCVNQYKKKHFDKQTMSPQKRDTIFRCIRAHVQRNLENNIETIDFFFNGGEILMEWDLLKSVPQWLATEYPDVNFNFSLNTNMTVMNDEIAEFLAKYKFTVSISIDGYKESHNKSRIYHNGKGSFDDIIRGLEIFRKYNTENPVLSYQGTIQDITDFDPRLVYEMETYGFVKARLAPNLLDIDEADAAAKAQLMGRFLELNENNKFQVEELFFLKAKNNVNLPEYRFGFNCRGLCCIPEISVNLNVSTMRLAQLCSYMPDSSMPLHQLDNDIHNPALWKNTFGLISRRMDMLKENCQNCSLIGLCGGGCIYTGLDNCNRINKPACTYQEKLWEIYLRKIYMDNRAAEEKEESQPEERDANTDS